ncbi:MAG: hypothetical protein ACRDRW_08640 [Pseudonocardiaceae bacterium]
MRNTIHRHPLAALRAHLGLSATKYLVLVAQRHRALGLGQMAIRREKVSRWEANLYEPERSAQLAMADLHAVPVARVLARGWPDWLLDTDALHTRADDVVFRGPWSQAGTIAALAADARGGSMDRRGFLIANGATLATITHGWLDELGAGSRTGWLAGRRRLTTSIVSHLDERLDHLRRLDDVLGGPELRNTALAECQLLQRLAANTTYDDAVGARLFSTISEAARICGWQHFDAGYHAVAQRFFTTSLRASATAGDPRAGAHTLSFLAIQTYSLGNPADAVHLVETAVDQTRHSVTPRTAAMLHVRLARALSKIPGGAQRCLAELGRAQDAYARGPHDDDPAWTYWLTDGELEMLAGSCALDLGRPGQALDHFALARGSTVESTRPTSALRDFTIRLSTEHAAHHGARAFLTEHRYATTTV